MEQHLQEGDPLRQRAGEWLAVRVLGPEGSVGCYGMVGHAFGFGFAYLKSNLVC